MKALGTEMIEPEITPLWEELIEFSDEICDLFSDKYIEVENSKHDQNFEGWEDTFWYGDNVRKCHLKTIITDKMWLMHINIFPKDGINLPILGFDIVATKSKISGSFFDYSPVSGDRSPLYNYYEKTVAGLEWNRPRELPEWAREIFSTSMIACGSIKQGEELDTLKLVTMKLLDYYVFNSNFADFENVGSTKAAHNKYCANQKTNRRLHQAINSMGIPEEQKMRYINNVLFEET
jgi:hypothetical protein